MSHSKGQKGDEGESLKPTFSKATSAIQGQPEGRRMGDPSTTTRARKDRGAYVHKVRTLFSGL